MYQQQPYPQHAQFVPSANPPSSTTRPGRTGAVAAVLSGLVPVVTIGAYLLARSVIVGFGYVYVEYRVYQTMFWGVPLLCAYLVPVIYLAIMGRGAAGKALGAGLMLAAMIFDIAAVAFFFFVRSTTTVEYIVGAVAGVVQAVLVALAWGLARRDGKLWFISIAVAVATAVLMIALTHIIDFQPGPALPLLNFVIANVVPIVLGWIIDAATRGAKVSAAPQYSVGQRRRNSRRGTPYQQGRPGPVGPPSGPPQNPPYTTHGR